MKEINQLLLEARANINKIDLQILKLLTNRMLEVERVTLAKKNQGVEIFAPGRELELLKYIENEGAKLGLDAMMVRDVFRAIIEGSKREQKQAMSDLVRIGFQGPRGSFGEQAAKLQKIQNKTTTIVPFDDISSIFKALEEQKIEFAVVPYQSSFELGADITIDLLLSSSFRIISETLLPLDLAIISSHKNLELKKVEKIYGTTWLFTRLGKVLDKLMPHASKCEVYSNSFYVDSVRDMDHKAVAIGSGLFAELNKLFVLKKLSSRKTGLVSRYIVIGEETLGETEQDYLTLAVELPNKKGNLNQLTSILAKHDISILNINLVYLRRAFCEHVFILDLSGHENNKKVKQALKEIKIIATDLRVLGSYPAHVSPNKTPQLLTFRK